MAIKDYNGSDPTSKLLASTSTNGFMSSNDKKKIDYTSNPNMLLNSNFKLWQRGTSITTIDSLTCYTADRWAIWHKGTATYTTSGLKLTGVSTQVYQILDDPLNDEYYTCSWSINNTIHSVTFKQKYVIDTELQAYNTSSNRALIGIYVKDGETLNWVKLEKGQERTQYIDPNPTLDALECYKYFQHLFSTIHDTYEYASKITYLGMCDLYVPMRIIPTINSGTIGGFNNGNGITTTTIHNLSDNINQLRFQYTFSSTAVSDSYRSRHGDFYVDAEYYS